jgi:hypothetical protein
MLSKRLASQRVFVHAIYLVYKPMKMLQDKYFSRLVITIMSPVTIIFDIHQVLFIVVCHTEFLLRSTESILNYLALKIICLNFFTGS